MLSLTDQVRFWKLSLIWFDDHSSQVITNSMCTRLNWDIKAPFFRVKLCNYKLYKIIILALTLTNNTLQNWTL